MALLIIEDEKENVGFNTDVIQIEKNPMTELSRDIDFNFEADHLYCYLSAVCSKELFDAIVERFNK